MTKDTDQMEQRRWYMCPRCGGVQVQRDGKERCSLCETKMQFVAKTFHDNPLVFVDVKAK